MKVLLLVRNVGLAEGAVYNRLRTDGHEVLVYDVDGTWLLPNRSTPTWMRGYRMRRSALAANHFRLSTADDAFDRVIAIGTEACGFAADVVERPFIPLLFRGSLDFSARRANLVSDLQSAFRACDRLLLDDDWEMDKACIKGSKLPHLVAPRPGLSNAEPLVSPGAEVSIGVVHPRVFDELRLHAYMDAVRAAMPDASVSPIAVESLYSTRDLRHKRDVAPTVRLRLAGFTHLMFIGSGPHHQVALDVLRPDWPKIVVEETIGARYLCDELGFSATGRGLNLVALLRQQVEGASGGCEPAMQTGTRGDYLRELDSVMAKPVDELSEELSAFSSDEPINVFFSAAPLEDRTNGARPQRIRNMAQALADAGPTVRVFSFEEAARRRFEMLRRVIGEGREVGLLYGENSTTPIASTAVIEDLGRFLEEFRAAGGRSGYFVRDLYWLEDDDEYVDAPEEIEAMRARGELELTEVCDRADVLFAPVRATGVLYNDLLENAGYEHRQWAPLPPAVAPANVCETAKLVGDDLLEGTTLLYAGGQGAVYGMDLYLTALRSLPADGYWFDFVAREGEVDNLRKALAEHELDGDPRVRISTVALDTYLPRTRRCIGINLLDSDYAKSGFQYKTISMLERSFSMLCYEDMAIAEFVTSHRYGIACERSADSILRGIERIAAEIASEDIAAAQRAQTWDRRVAEIRAALGAE